MERKTPIFETLIRPNLVCFEEVASLKQSELSMNYPPVTIMGDEFKLVEQSAQPELDSLDGSLTSDAKLIQKHLVKVRCRVLRTTTQCHEYARI